MFIDRKDAGRRLSKELERFKSESPLILAVPRGGVVIAHEIIKELALEWDLIIPRKIGAPHNKEVAIGAVSYDGSYFTDKGYVAMLGISDRYMGNSPDYLKEVSDYVTLSNDEDGVRHVLERFILDAAN